MAENGELHPVRHCFVLEGNVLLSPNELKKLAYRVYGIDYVARILLRVNQMKPF